MADIAALTQANADRWRKAKPTRSFASTAKRLFSAKGRYQVVTRSAGVPWWVIAVIHEREASQRWDRQLAQGDPIDKKSTHVPKGRGPFDRWENAAVDALCNCPPYAARWKDWSAGGTLTLLESYNGLGYANRGIPSPYIWSGTDQYKAGKYIADGKFSATAVDKQLGCAGLILALRALDPTVRFTDENLPPPDVEPHEPKQKQPPTMTQHTAAAGAVTLGTAIATLSWDWRFAVLAFGLGLLAAFIIYMLHRSK